MEQSDQKQIFKHFFFDHLEVKNAHKNSMHVFKVEIHFFACRHTAYTATVMMKLALFYGK